jgi:hypothetical protein
VLGFYRAVGGRSIPGLSLQAILPAMAALLVHFIVVALVWAVISPRRMGPKRSGPIFMIEHILRFMLMAVGLPFLAFPFGLLAAGLSSRMDWLSTCSLSLGCSWWQSWPPAELAVESSRQQSRQQKLEHLGRDIINSPPDVEKLAGLLDEHVPTMFPPGRVVFG